MKLIIGNKNYSSWSMRAFVALRQAGIEFDEERISFNDPTWKKRIATAMVPGQVPILVDRDLTIWDSIAILEYAAERFPERGLWPSDSRARAVARSVCAQMHSSFMSVRRHLPMNISARLPGLGWNIAVQNDVDTIVSLWQQCRAHYGTGGPFLFGMFSNADAMFAPVVMRFQTYAIDLPEPARIYCDEVRSTTAVEAWVKAAAQEVEFVVQDEPYRHPRKPS